ncbi:aminodeoxychorismate/anthranilate synthase component II [bacterium]|nr:aminodeoxychorismate/anthranilate synthase component II [bacterium]MBU1983997.1 aminodeoxychorismate/anthranilate synthase component II [bacterium]
MIFILDNYDSFTYNLVQAVRGLGEAVHVARNDEVTAAGILERRPSGLILSPGPGRPEAAGNMPQIFAELADQLPILGVCLGHQMIARHYGGQIITASRLVHGKADLVRHDNRGVLRGLPDPFAAGRYHSLAVDKSRVPECLEISARSEDGEIMGLRHRKLPVNGVQFHPESILTPEGLQIIRNFISSTRRFPQPVRSTPSYA